MNNVKNTPVMFNDVCCKNITQIRSRRCVTARFCERNSFGAERSQKGGDVAPGGDRSHAQVSGRVGGRTSQLQGNHLRKRQKSPRVLIGQHGNVSCLTQATCGIVVQCDFFGAESGTRLQFSCTQKKISYFCLLHMFILISK